MTRYEMIAKLLGIWTISITIVLQANPTGWYSNDEMATLYEAMTKISSESLYVDPQHSTPEEILKNYIYKIDAYGDYFTKKEYKAFQHTLSPEYAGIGMILYQQKRNEKILCIPTKKNLKEVGISRYDQLISVDGRSVNGKNFYLVSSWIRGRKNSSVTLELLKPSGKLQTITLKRTEQYFQTIQRVIDNGTAMIQIIRFMKETPEELRSILHQWPKNIPILIDLRGNGGGDLFAAIQSADLLLPKDTLISSVETTKSCFDYRASNPDYMQGQAVLLLQDEFTASAAEVFIAALTQNHRAESTGKKSFGKGVAQKFIPLSNGDALLLTYGKITTPNGESYHKKGLLPTSDLSLSELLDNLDSNIKEMF
ncbi:S41 family peptidase [Sulfurovum sp. CS9]|uniref:S41 family peptidase n=1 Tax=Sulfurovum sp. CS9 TaxID=3391146 RepID=UPI0039E993FC